MSNTNKRLTHKQIKGVCTADPKGKDYVICPECGGHLHLFGTDDYGCFPSSSSTGSCSHDAVTRKLHSMVDGEPAKPKEKKPKPSELPEWQGFTLDDYCAAKGLNRRIMEQFFDARTVTRGKPVVAWTYCNPENGKPVATKLRKSSSSHDTYFEPADPHVPYGTNNPLLKNLVRGTYDLFIAEGETDTHVLASWGLAVIGVSGSKGWLPEYADLPIVENAKRVFVVEQSDEAAKQDFTAKIIRALPKAFILRTPDGVKDFGELHLKYLDYEESEVELFGHPFVNFLNIAIQAAVMERATRLPRASRPKPNPMREDAFYGLAGKVISLLEPRLECDRATILTNFLGCAGVLFQRAAHFKVVADTHYPVDYYLTVGNSATSRKGTTMNAVVELFERAQPGFKKRIMGGLSTGQGLISALIKPTPEDEEPAGDALPEPIAESVLVEISEFEELLAVMRRDENTLSAVMRDAWDGRPLAVLTRKEPLKVDNVSLGTIAHITRRGLLDKLTATERANGFANRFLFVWSDRAKFLPRGDISNVNYNEVVEELHAALKTAQGRGAIKRDDDANQLWDAEYLSLSLRGDSMIDALLSRAEAHVVRLSLLYALLDGSSEIRKVHLQAALAVWDYCEASVLYIFGDAAEPEYRKILRKLEDGPLTLGEVRRDVFGDNKPSEWVEEKIAHLEQLRKIRRGVKELKTKTCVAWYLNESLEVT